MTRRLMLGGLMFLALGASTRGEDKSPVPKAAPTHPGLERIKKLAGTWVAADKDGKPTDQVVSVVQVTAACLLRGRRSLVRGQSDPEQT